MAGKVAIHAGVPEEDGNDLRDADAGGSQYAIGDNMNASPNKEKHRYPEQLACMLLYV